MVFQDWAVPQLCFPQWTCITFVLFSLNKVSPLTTPPFEDSCWCWIGKMTSVDTFYLNSHAGINLILASLYKPHPAYPVLPFSSYLKPFIWSIYKPQNGGCHSHSPFCQITDSGLLAFFFFLRKLSGIKKISSGILGWNRGFLALCFSLPCLWFQRTQSPRKFGWFHDVIDQIT